ncbi:MAG: hypothetical protein QME42_09380 [bacterium]|nr:hypothetical protein [bacterium]
MLVKEHIIEKVHVLPDNILREVDDFIDFLEIKRKKEENQWGWLSGGIDKIEESDFKDYLDGLTSYEDMLAKGEVRWK